MTGMFQSPVANTWSRFDAMHWGGAKVTRLLVRRLPGSSKERLAKKKTFKFTDCLLLKIAVNSRTFSATSTSLQWKNRQRIYFGWSGFWFYHQAWHVCQKKSCNSLPYKAKTEAKEAGCCFSRPSSKPRSFHRTLFLKHGDRLGRPGAY